MKLSHIFLILVVVMIWGLNFVFIRIGLNELPPFLLCAMRFLLAACPAVFFIRKPQVPIHHLACYGLIMFALQFGFLFSGMQLGMPPSLASLMMQFQVFFTMGLAHLFFNERPSLWKMTGACISFSGILFVAFHTQIEMSLIGLCLTLLASLSWASGNIISKKMGNVPAFALVTWGSLFASPFLFIASLLFEGMETISVSLSHMSWLGVCAIGFIVYGSTHLAYSFWSFLLRIYPTSSIAPFTMLVPVFGFFGAHLILHEPIPPWKLISATLVIAGLAFNWFEGRSLQNLALSDLIEHQSCTSKNSDGLK